MQELLIASESEASNLIASISTDKPFIEANTIASSLAEIKKEHVIPVFLKDNEPVISQSDFIEITQEVVANYYSPELILMPSIRLSHPIKGRIPEAKDKPAIQLLDHEKTIYYERMAFLLEVPGIKDEIDGSLLTLTIGGIKSYSLDNLYSKKGADEHFKLFIGFKNKVCTNLCVWTDGLVDNLRVQSIGQLKASIRTMIENYNANFHIEALHNLISYSLTEKQFSSLVGKCKMYNYLPNDFKREINPFLLSDTQLSMVVRDYYRDESFCRMADGNINLWRLYNLLTGANRSSYIDSFITRSVNACEFVDAIKNSLNGKVSNWFLS